jgi:hypothetical protein
MPNESRVINFSNSEATDALVEYCVSTKRELPKGGIERLGFSNDAEIKVTAEFKGGAPAMSFYQNEVAAALIQYCGKKGIPVARRAVKSLLVAQDTVALHITLRS